MAEGDAQKRLAAIVAIDVPVYSRLMGVDAEGTLAILNAHCEAVTLFVRGHGGCIVGSTSDSQN